MTDDEMGDIVERYADREHYASWLRKFADRYQGDHSGDSPQGVDAAMMHEIASVLAGLS